jgi:hypothetical protein
MAGSIFVVPDQRGGLMEPIEMERLTHKTQLAAVSNAAKRLSQTLNAHPSLRLGFIYDDGASSETTELDLPTEVVKLFLGMLELLAKQNSISLSVKKVEMTTEETARFLGISRSLVIKEAESGRLMFRMSGNRRIILLQDAIRFRDEHQKR